MMFLPNERIEETEQFDKLAAWAKETKTGDRSDLSFMPQDSCAKS